MRGKVIDEYVGELEELGVTRFLEEHAAPVLLRAGSFDIGSGSAGFRTVGVKRVKLPWRAPTPPASKRSDRDALELAAEGDVWEIVKRVGGPFPTRIGVGRVDTADITLPFGPVSKFHAYFEESGGLWYLIDAGSTNGTFVDGTALEPRLRAYVRDGARIEFGPFAFQICSPQLFVKRLEDRLARVDIASHVER